MMSIAVHMTAPIKSYSFSSVSRVMVSVLDKQNVYSRQHITDRPKQANA